MIMIKIVFNTSERVELGLSTIIELTVRPDFILMML